jgi:hypothetical protein
VGCTSIPSAGPVFSADIDSRLSEVDFDFLPPGPSAGATPEEILAGFIAELIGRNSTTRNYYLIEEEV